MRSTILSVCRSGGSLISWFDCLFRLSPIGRIRSKQQVAPTSVTTGLRKKVGKLIQTIGLHPMLKTIVCPLLITKTRTTISMIASSQPDLMQTYFLWMCTECDFSRFATNAINGVCRHKRGESPPWSPQWPTRNSSVSIILRTPVYLWWSNQPRSSLFVLFQARQDFYFLLLRFEETGHG